MHYKMTKIKALIYNDLMLSYGCVGDLFASSLKLTNKILSKSGLGEERN